MNPCSGVLLQSTPSRARAFFSHVKDLHRWVAFRGSRHEGLRAIKDGSQPLVPPHADHRHRAMGPSLLEELKYPGHTVPRIGLKGGARDWNWHNVAGIWAAVPLLLISLTGTIMAYGWATNLLYRRAGSPSVLPLG